MLEYTATQRQDLFAELVRRYERELYNYLRRYLGDAELADDVFQATFLQIHLKSGQFEAGRKVRPWLYTIATNQAIDAQRRNKRHRMVSLDRSGASDAQEETGKLADMLVSAEQDPHANLLAHERGALVSHALESLTEQMRHVVQLVYYQGLKYREAAEILAIPVGTVKSRLNAAISKLTDYWKQNSTSQP